LENGITHDLVRGGGGRKRGEEGGVLFLTQPGGVAQKKEVNGYLSDCGRDMWFVSQLVSIELRIHEGRKNRGGSVGRKFKGRSMRLTE